MDPIAALNARGGVARLDTLRRAGVSTHALRVARERGLLASVCRGWVALIGADAMLVAAARRGVVLSCVTLAARRELWALDSSEPHVAAPPNAGHARISRGTVHWNLPLFPRDPDSCEDSLENALVLIARCQPYESALAVWESALRKGMVDLDVMRRMPLPPSARRVIEDARPFADAGTKTIFLARLRWPGIPIVPQAWVLGHRVDCLIGERLRLRPTVRTPPNAAATPPANTTSPPRKPVTEVTKVARHAQKNPKTREMTRKCGSWLIHSRRSLDQEHPLRPQRQCDGNLVAGG